LKTRPLKGHCFLTLFLLTFLCLLLVHLEPLFVTLTLPLEMASRLQSTLTVIGSLCFPICLPLSMLGFTLYTEPAGFFETSVPVYKSTSLTEKLLSVPVTIHTSNREMIGSNLDKCTG
jgi:hypothetical protein